MTTTTSSTSVRMTKTDQPRKRPSLGRVLAWTAMVLILLFTLLPFYWVLRLQRGHRLRSHEPAAGGYQLARL